MCPRQDWEQHLADYKGSYYLGGEYKDALVKHTLCHWTSLFAVSNLVLPGTKTPGVLEILYMVSQVVGNFKDSFVELEKASLALDAARGSASGSASGNASSAKA